MPDRTTTIIFPGTLLKPFQFASLVDYPAGIAGEAHSHPCYQVVYVASGAMRFTSPNASDLIATAGEAAVIPPDMPHDWREHSGGISETFCMLIDPLIKERHGMLSTVFGASQGIWWKARIDKSPAKQQIAAIHKSFSDKRPMSGEILSGRMLSFLALIGRCSVEQNVIKALVPDGVIIEKSLQYIDRNIDNNFTLKELANICHLSVSRFSELFRKYTGKAPMNYVQNLKIEKAKSILLYSHLGISEIAEHLGFSSVHYFSRAFKKETGIPPTHYRSAHLKS